MVDACLDFINEEHTLRGARERERERRRAPHAVAERRQVDDAARPMRDANCLAPERRDDVEVFHILVEDLEKLDGELLLALVDYAAEVLNERLGRVVRGGGHGEDAVHRHLVRDRGPWELQCDWRGAIHTDFDSDSCLLRSVFRKPRSGPAAR